MPGLALIQCAEAGGLQALGQNLFAETTASGPAQNGTPGLNGLGSLVQGSLEGSNVNPLLEMTSLIEISRAYESVTRMIENTTDLSRRAVERLGKAA